MWGRQRTPHNDRSYPPENRHADGAHRAAQGPHDRTEDRLREDLTRLGDRFRLLTGGSRTALPRQQTLRSAIDWSYDLLSDAEKALLGRLSVFMGGWTLEAGERVVPLRDGAGVVEVQVVGHLGEAARPEERARLRGEFIRQANLKGKDYRVDWVYLKLNDPERETILCKDPFQSHDERVERLIRSF